MRHEVVFVAGVLAGGALTLGYLMYRVLTFRGPEEVPPPRASISAVRQRE